MKKINIVLLVLIAGAVAVIVANFGSFSTYETFASAAAQPGKQYHIIGHLDKQKGMNYDPLKDPNHFTFYVKDKSGTISQVIFNGSKPTDIEKSEQIVMTGYIDGKCFRCSKIQMKCPSKYKKDMVAVGS